jgi:hypothetical protein
MSLSSAVYGVNISQHVNGRVQRQLNDWKELSIKISDTIATNIDLAMV